MPFPPVPVFPNAIDSDRTLFLVHDTAEARLSEDNSSWSSEVQITPVPADKPELWADNGFANIDGEMFYYDSVEKNSNGKVVKLKGCARNLGGTDTKYCRKGTWVRGFVVAEQHNQIADAVLNIENFVGRNFDDRQFTLDWRIRNLQALPVVWDDFACPDINFTFNVIEDSAETGVLTEYFIEITPPGIINTFRLDFGDGEFTTTELEGQHRYAVNTRIDPVVTVSNDKCQSIQTPIERDNPAEPPPEIVRIFDIPIPEVPDVPDFIFVPCDVPEPDINLPPLVFPCISLEGQIGPIPSVIIGPDIIMVSHVTITGPDYPINLPSNVTITGPDIPSHITIDSPTIVIDPPIPATIVIVPPASSIMLELDATNLPKFQIDWGPPPDLQVQMTMARRVKAPQRMAVDDNMRNEFGVEFADLFAEEGTMTVEYEPVGIPSEINVIPPSSMPTLRIDKDDLSQLSNLKLDFSEAKIPDIKISSEDLPTLRLDCDDVPDTIGLVYEGEGIKIDASSVPKYLTLKMEKDIPDKIIVEIPEPIPSTIFVDASSVPSSIALVGPESIPLHLPANLGIPVIFPEEMPSIRMVYEGPQVLKITMDEIMMKDKEGKNCFYFVPCGQ